MDKMEWISVEDRLPNHMQEVKVYMETVWAGSFERTNNAVFLWFKDTEAGDFYDANEQIHLTNVTKWKPISS